MEKKIESRFSTTPETWACVDCGFDTAPGVLSRERMEAAFAADHQAITYTVDDSSEIYMVRNKVWKAAGMSVFDDSGCLCIGCLEKRLGRTLVPKDFSRRHPCNRWPGTERLRARRDRVVAALHHR